LQKNETEEIREINGSEQKTIVEDTKMDFLMGHLIKSDKTSNGHVHQKSADNETKSIMHIGFHFNSNKSNSKHSDSDNNINSILKDFSNELNNKILENKNSESHFRMKQINLHKNIMKHGKLGQAQNNKLAQINIHLHGM
jgi:hypothetical protein